MPAIPEYRELITLPPPATRGHTSVEEVLSRRRSVRDYGQQALTEPELSQLLWSAQGITDRDGMRTAPSAGALYPLELYVLTADGVFHYVPRGHRLGVVSDRDRRRALAEASLNQEELAQAPATFVLAAVFERAERKYGHARGERYVVLEVGHAAQNLLLQAAALGIVGVPIGAFEDARVREAIGLPPDHDPLYLIALGRPR